MKKNQVKEKLKNNIPSIGTWVSTGDPFVCEVISRLGLDWITIDLEHNAVDFSQLVHCFRAIQGSPSAPFVRVPWNDRQVIKRVLDIGAMGIVIPDIKDPEDALNAVSACRYAPVGLRGIGASRPNTVYGDDYYQKANDEICVVLMIEDIKAVEKIDDILNVSGIDVIFIGPNDLASSMGISLGMDNNNPDHKEAVNKVYQACANRGIPMGIHCGDGKEVEKRIKEGMLWMPIASDVRLLKSSFEEELKKIYSFDSISQNDGKTFY